ncbi:resolvase [Micromonospora tulbaghiae]|uniref:Resolvase n=1 Tax=Micromonospora tulbaghiae TaxID=479978 RepID=A0A386WQP5_9ACTN|nr:recombinase family protein [Micromonospora tulbaghiae]AYF30776.1 resolvase [Micromonospora tulbaghiae]
MVRRKARSGNQGRFDSKDALLAGGGQVRALRYQRASQDKKEQGKSVHDQGVLNLAEITKRSWTDAGSFTDNHRSASRRATREREQFELLIEQIRAGKGDVLVVWEISRKERDLAVFVKIRDMCHEVGLYFWLVGGVLYDLRDKNDRMMLGFQAVQAEWMAEAIRDNVMRGIVGAAEAGRPHGKITYGYRRIYDQRTRALLRQEPDDEIRTAVAADGTVTEYSHAQVVRDNFRLIAAGMPLTAREAELNRLGTPASQGGVWRRGILRKQVMNPAYIGKRVLRGEIVGDGIWPALVSEETYWAVVRMLGDPARTTTRPGRAVHLLSYIVRCGVCDGPLSSQRQNRHGWTGQVYSCLHKRHVGVKAPILDEYVQRAVVAWLSRPDVHDILTATAGSDEDVTHARAEAQRLRGELEDWRRLAEDGDVTAIAYARAEKGLLAQIAEHEQRAADAGIPAVLRGRIGDHAVQAWQELDGNIPVKREIIRLVADIKLLPAAYKGDRSPFGRHRLHWNWNFDPHHHPKA